MGVTEVRFLEPRRLNPGETLEGFSCGVELIDMPLMRRSGVRRFHTCVSQQVGKLRASMRLVRIQLIVMP